MNADATNVAFYLKKTITNKINKKIGFLFRRFSFPLVIYI